MRRGPSGRVEATIPDEDPRGMGVGGVLTSDLYGLRSQLDSETLTLLDRKRDLAARESLSSSEQAELDTLNSQLGGLDFTTISRDPLYKPYVDAITALEPVLGLRKATLTSEEIQRRQGLAESVINELLREIGD